MKCPNCGAEMPAGSLYCEQCGEDIHIVPDFEPEVEFNIEQTIQGIAEDILEDESLSETPQDMDMEEEEGLGYRRWVFYAILVGVLCLIVMIGGVLIFQHNSLQFQLKRAEACVAGGQYDRAVRYYERALQLEDTGDDVNIKFALADVYFQKNNKIEYEYVLREIVKDPHATLEQISSAYGKLIAIYRAREDYESINELLLASDDEDVMRTYRNYLASAPEFSVAASEKYIIPWTAHSRMRTVPLTRYRLFWMTEIIRSVLILSMSLGLPASMSPRRIMWKSRSFRFRR